MNKLYINNYLLQSYDTNNKGKVSYMCEVTDAAFCISASQKSSCQF